LEMMETEVEKRNRKEKLERMINVGRGSQGKQNGKD